jgi:hypothetical protein
MAQNNRATRGGGKVTDATGMVAVHSGSNPGSAADWFGPGNPPPPMAPAEVAGRSFDYPFAVNQQTRPRAFEAISFETLRALANSYDVLRLVIETRKDQIAAQEWVIVPKDEKTKVVGDVKKRCDDLTALFLNPYTNMDWDTWVRAILEDMFVIDAPTIYPRKTKGGAMYGFKPIDGATIKRVIDDWGDTPMGGTAAYQQVLKGVGAVNYTFDQLVYRPRNVRTDKIYGYSPVEQVIAIINIALRRETWQLEYFTSGSLPDALIGTPDAWTPDQLRSFQDWFDARLQGNTAARRGATFVPGDVAKGYVATKETELFGNAEEWLARVICFAFSMSPQPFTMMMNRATAQTAKSAAAEEGLKPIMKWVSNLVNFLIGKYCGVADLEFKWVLAEDIDPAIAAKVIDADVAAGVITREEAREKKGLEPSGNPEAAILQVTTASGPVPLSVDAQIEQSKKKQDHMPKPVAPAGAPGSNDNKGSQPPKGEAGGQGSASGGSGGGGGDSKAPKSAALSPHAHPHAHAHQAPSQTKAASNPTDVNRPLGRRVAKGFQKALKAALADTGDDVAHQVVKALNKARGVTRSADHGDGKSNDDRMGDIATGTLTASQIEELVSSIDLSSLEVIVDAMDEGFYDIASDTALKALAQVGVKATDDLVNRVNQAAVDFARTRSAELVGMRFNAAGDLVQNPNAAYAITDSTREMLRSTISQGLADNIGTDAIAEAIQGSFAFSAERANLIAMTEVRNANEQSKLEGWRAAGEAGVTVMKSWQVSNNENTCDICEGNDADGLIDLDADFSSGDDAAPAHPNCFAAGTLVEGAFLAGAQAAYKGPMREIITRSGARLTLTRYHPVFTAQGIRSAATLQVGDYAIRYSPTIEGDGLVVVADENNGPAAVEKVVQAIRFAGGARTVEASVADFHGDAMFIEGEVDIVATDRRLLDRAIAAGDKLERDLVLISPDVGSVSLNANGTLDEVGLAPKASSNSGVGLSSSGKPLGFGGLGRAKGMSLAVRADVNAALLKAASKDVPTDPSLDGHGLLGLPCNISLDEIVEVRDFEASCHVYDLQTESGWLVASGLLVSNCECVTVPEVVQGGADGGDGADNE